jgi:hypothetical protein
MKTIHSVMLLNLAVLLALAMLALGYKADQEANLAHIKAKVAAEDRENCLAWGHAYGMRGVPYVCIRPE